MLASRRMRTSIVNPLGSKRERIEGWPGYVHRQRDGRPLFIIEKQVTVTDDAGNKTRHRFHVSTRAHSLKPALEQLQRFEADPFAYNPVGGDLRAPLVLTAGMLVQFYDWQVAQGLTPKYARETFTWLKRWVRALKGVNLRSARLARDVMPALDAARPGARRPLMASLKTLFAWLRTERHELTSAEDATRDLKLAQSAPAKHRKKVAHAVADVRKVAELLKGVYRDALLFQWATSCHVSELERFVRDGRSRLVVYRKPQRLADGSKAIAQVELWHKTGKIHRVALTRPEHVEAAGRLRKRGSLPSRSDLNAMIYAACAKAKVPRMSFVMRHTTLTRAAALGVSEGRRMAHAGHQDARTARRYVDVELPLGALPVEKL